jgi:hypothetical protein
MLNAIPIPSPPTAWCAYCEPLNFTSVEVTESRAKPITCRAVLRRRKYTGGTLKCPARREAIIVPIGITKQNGRSCTPAWIVEEPLTTWYR